MRLAFHAALVCGLAALSTVRADDFPYEAFVVADKAEVVAGPGHRFYATDRLARGTKVEIYNEEPSGWLAIKPPEGSFSWVPGEFVERIDEGTLGRVKEPTGAWIGTSVEHVGEHQQQVTLKAGELVQILGEKSVTAKSGGERTWIKIAPPAGEYRWIHLRDVSRQMPKEPKPQIVTAETKSDDERAIALAPAVSQSEREELSEPRRFEFRGSAIALRDLEEPRSGRLRVDRSIERAQFRTPSSSDSESRPVSPDGFVPRKRRDHEQPAVTSVPIRTTTTPAAIGARLDPDARIASATPARPALASGSTSGSGLSGDEIAWQLDQIEIDLSLMIAQDRSQWNLPALRKRIETLVENGADPASRGRARLVLDKIKQFENVFDRDARTLTSSGQGSTGRLMADAGGTRPAGGAPEKTQPASGSLADPRYDAQGWLKPVISRKSDKPVAPYAVVDAEGQPLCFVSPSPGLNLHRYENKQVGLYGRRGYLEELRKPHLVAERVIELDGQLR